MEDRTCYRRMRIHTRAITDDNRDTWEHLLQMVDGVMRVQARAITNRLLVEFDDRKVEAWQLTALAERLTARFSQVAPAAAYPLRLHQTYLAIPVLLAGGLFVRRTLLGRSQIADNLILFQLATLFSVASGYPPVRARVSRVAQRLHLSDDVILSTAALMLAMLRESYLVLAALFALSYKSYRKRDNTLSAVAAAGDLIARIDSENREPASVSTYGAVASRVGFLLSGASVLQRRGFEGISAHLLAANPRPGMIAAKYAMNHAEVIAHEDCAYLPLACGQDLYDLLQYTTVVVLDEVVSQDVRQALAHRGVHVVSSLPVPHDRQRVIVLYTMEPPLECSDTTTLVVKGTAEQFLRTLDLSRKLRRIIQGSTWTSGVWNAVASLLVARGMPAPVINRCSDGLTLTLLTAVEAFV